METVIKALSAIPGISWSISQYHHKPGVDPEYYGSLHTSTGTFPGTMLNKSYTTKTQSDPHDVLVELLGVALKWQEQGESQA